MRKVAIVTIVCIGFVVLTLALLFQSRRSVRPPGITVAFCHFTNDMAGVRLAAFRVSNTGGCTLFRWPLYVVEERGRLTPLIQGTCGSGALRPGDSIICLFPAPNNGAPWRAIFTFSDDNWHRKLTVLPWVRGLLPGRFCTLPVREGVSDWVGDISTVAAAPYRDRVAAVILRSPAKIQQQTNATVQVPSSNVANMPLSPDQERSPATTNLR